MTVATLLRITLEAFENSLACTLKYNPEPCQVCQLDAACGEQPSRRPGEVGGNKRGGGAWSGKDMKSGARHWIYRAWMRRGFSTTVWRTGSATVQRSPSHGSGRQPGHVCRDQMGGWSASPTRRSLSPPTSRLTCPGVDGNVFADIGICRVSFPSSADAPVACPLRKRLPAASGLPLPVDWVSH
jgi:hypothetical protein